MDGFVQPVAALGEWTVPVTCGPVIVTVPPTSTVVFAPVMPPVLRMQRLPFVAMFVTKTSVSIVRHGEVASW